MISPGKITARAPTQNQSNPCRRRWSVNKNIEVHKTKIPVNRKFRMGARDLAGESLKDTLTMPRIIIETINSISKRCSRLATTGQEYGNHSINQGKIKIMLLV